MRTEPCEHCAGTGKQLDQRAVGEQMRKRRKRKGLTLRTVAKQLEISTPFLSDLERGRRNWSRARLEEFQTATA